MVLWPGTQRTREKEEAEGKTRMFLLAAAPPGAGGGLLPWGSSGSSVPTGPARCQCSSPEPVFPGSGTAEQLLEKGKTGAHRALWVWEREGTSKSLLPS